MARHSTINSLPINVLNQTLGEKSPSTTYSPSPAPSHFSISPEFILLRILHDTKTMLKQHSSRMPDVRYFCVNICEFQSVCTLMFSLTSCLDKKEATPIKRRCNVRRISVTRIYACTTLSFSHYVDKKIRVIGVVIFFFQISNIHTQPRPL